MVFFQWALAEWVAKAFQKDAAHSTDKDAAHSTDKDAALQTVNCLEYKAL